MIGLPATLTMIPFVETSGRDKATAALPCLAEGRLVRGGFATRVDEYAADFFVIGPMRDEAPAHGAQFSAPVVSQDDRSGLRGRNHRARGELVRAEVNRQHGGQFHGINSLGIASAHAEILIASFQILNKNHNLGIRIWPLPRKQ